MTVTMQSAGGGVGIEVRELRPGTVVVSVAGDIDVATAEVVRGAVHTAVEEEPRHLVMDLTTLGFLDSTGLGILAGARAQLAAWDGALTVVSPSPRLRKHFAITGMDAFIRLVPDLGSVGVL